MLGNLLMNPNWGADQYCSERWVNVMPPTTNPPLLIESSYYFIATFKIFWLQMPLNVQYIKAVMWTEIVKYAYAWVNITLLPITLYHASEFPQGSGLVKIVLISTNLMVLISLIGSSRTAQSVTYMCEYIHWCICWYLGPLLLPWINFNSSMDQ